ncbi:hypothetical protein V8F20_009152 [Naviculisporaceae sp. PSN 640]
MRLVFLPALAFSGIVSSQLVVPLHRGPPRPDRQIVPPYLRPGSRVLPDQAQAQVPLMDSPALGPGPVVPPPESGPAADPPSDSAGGGDSVILSDVMGKDRSINLFAGFVRDIESAAQRLDDASSNTTVLAPLNSAVENLPRKPWEDPRDYGALGPNAYEGEDGTQRAHKNLQRFVERHMVPVSPWPKGEKVKAIGDDQNVWWEEKDGRKFIQPGNIEVVSVASKVANGEVWILKGVRNYA